MSRRIPAKGVIIAKAKQTVTISIDAANSLKTMVKWFAGAIKAGNMPETEDRSDELTLQYCSDLMKELSNAE